MILKIQMKLVKKIILLQIVRENGTDKVYISFGAMLTDISKNDLTKLYKIVMRKHGMNEPEDEFKKILWEYLKNMFEEPISIDSIWSLPERKYPLSAEVCKAMLDKKLKGGKPDEDCYKLLKMMEKQAGIRKHKDWLVQEQTALGKDFSNPLMADNLPKIVWLSTHHIWIHMFKLCLDSYNALQAKYDELQSEFGNQEAALVAHKIAVKKLESQLKASHKQQSSLTEKLNFQANQIFEKDEKLKKYRRIGMKAVKDKDALQQIFDSWSASSKNLWKLIDCGMSSTVKIGLGYGIKSNAEVLGYEEEISRGIFAFRETNAGYNDIPLYSRFKQVEYKGVPHPLSGDYTPREQEDIDDSLYEYGKYGPQPQSPSPIESDASSTVSSTCQSNDSDGEQGTVSDHSVNDDPIPIPSSEQVTTSTQKTQPQVPKPQQTVDPSCRVNVKTGHGNDSSGNMHVNSGTQIKSGASIFNT
ncbi:hypothetical protein Tco_0736052 [Tanacetum coccineum]